MEGNGGSRFLIQPIRDVTSTTTKRSKMGVDRNYFCCLCRERMNVGDLHGIHFCSRHFKKVDAQKTEHHLCDFCLESAAAIHEQYAAMRPTRDTTHDQETEQDG